MAKKYQNKKLNVLLAAILLSLVFATLSVFIRMMSQDFTVLQQSYMRVGLAAAIALIIFRGQLSKSLAKSLTPKEWVVYISRASLTYFAGTVLYTYAVRNSELSIVTLISAIPIAGLLAFFMFREKFPLSSMPFLMLSIAGLFILTGASFDITFEQGIIAAVLSHIAFGIGYLMARFHSPKRSNYETTVIILLFGWIPSLVLSIAFHEPLPSQISVASMIGLVGGAMSAVLGLYLTNYVFRNLRAYVAGNLLLLEILWAVLFGVVLYGEPVTIPILIGGLLIVMSAMAINKIDNKEKGYLKS